LYGYQKNFEYGTISFDKIQFQPLNTKLIFNYLMTRFKLRLDLYPLYTLWNKKTIIINLKNSFNGLSTKINSRQYDLSNRKSTETRGSNIKARSLMSQYETPAKMNQWTNIWIWHFCRFPFLCRHNMQTPAKMSQSMSMLWSAGN
jgi:hypothetical protein